ncbi:hypothetical protein DBT_1141 [Dissulfuribacter thermophilus]|uniref:ATPase n=1 Tax=Dissulfuribacter thermophilus TaxID=1156395 RepID=A0A1B9F6D2_9BACT|nr:ATP-binding protein [Dissulfuribacter thermophilus]OCC15394.1 hypothetical protein DBT_1141 [Dissulfuribacter thermophilus]
METLLFRFNPWWESYNWPDFVPREGYLKSLLSVQGTRDIILLTGLRRTGKTTLMKMAIQALIRDYGIKPSYIFYCSLDYYGLEHYSIMEIVEEFLKIQKISTSEKTFLFLDEVAYKEDFSLQLKNLYDTFNVKIYASSSASVLKDEKAHLTGRERMIEILPLDFHDFLKFKNLSIKKADRHLLESAFLEYMETGGMPEYVLTGDPEYIKQLVDDIIYKDIISRYKIKDETAVRDFFRLLMERAGKQLTLNKISKILGMSVDTARRFLNYFSSTYIIYTVERCGKLNERLKSPKKVYAGDIGIRNAVTGMRDLGAIFENLVFFAIMHKRPCYLLKNGVEIDFFTEDRWLIEAKYGQKLTQKQAKLFESVDAKGRLVVDSLEGLQELYKLLGRHYGA